MTTLKSYTQADFTNLKSFKAAVKNVAGGTQDRFKQFQQLLIVGVLEAAKVSESGQVSNNLEWLSALLESAEAIKGFPTQRISKYIHNVLCCGTVKWDSKKKKLSKRTKDTALEYNIEPATTWLDHEKPEKAEVNFGKRFQTAAKSALDAEKGGLALSDLVGLLVGVDGITAESLMDALNSKGTTEQLAEALAKAA